ncbi:MAG: HAD-IIIC family phosphatase [Thermodesulfobacteriota bacterium]|nr:HAD-IIIC family phosphatase [Thermodesulfobacteriota bacterium]
MERSYAEIMGFLNAADLSQMAKLKVSILRNVMLETIEPYICYLGYRAGFNAQVRFGEYDNIFQEAAGGNAELFDNTDCVSVFMKLESISWDLGRAFGRLTLNQVRSELDRIQTHIRAVLKGIRRQTDAMILWHGFEVPPHPAYGIWDSQIDSGQGAIIGELNNGLRAGLREVASAYYVDLNLCLARVGAKRFYDPRLWHIGRGPFTREALLEIAHEDFKFIRTLKGKHKKCLVLDCDNVLWGGIIGEEGLPGIKLGKTYPGSPYYEFQHEVLNLYNRGVILALCSKNNAADVWEVFEKHPDMVLKEEHIAAAEINWQDKAHNLRQIALGLNIGMDSMVFIDDSEFEINLIREVLPDVEVIHFPQDTAVEYAQMLASCGLFDTFTLSEEDKKRGAMYKSEASRKKLQAQATDMGAYYKSLEMKLEVRFVDEFAVPRVAQLTQKTNQFNLTTRRYSDADIKGLTNSDESDVIYVRLKDRFGDSGIVGVCILKYKDKIALFDTFLLSCRVLGRGAEDAFIVQALKLATKRGCEAAIGEYFATPKNSQVKNFYPMHGFRSLEEKQETSGATFQYEIGDKVTREPEFFAKIDSEIDHKGEI